MRAAADTRHLFALQLRAFSLTWLCYASYYLTRKNLAVVKSRLHTDLGVSTFELATLDTAYLIAYAVGQFLSGAVGDRIGSRRLLTVGLLGSATTALVFGLSSTFFPMFVAFAINGIFQSTGWSGNLKAIQPFLHTRYRGRVMGFWSTNYQVGGLAATALATYLLVHFGWRSAFTLPALWVLGMGVAIYLLLIEKPEDRGLPPVEVEARSKLLASSESNPNPAANITLFQLLGEPLMLTLGGAYFGLKLIRYSLLFWLPFYLRQHFHYSESQAGYLSLPFEIGGIVGSVVVGWVSDRYFRTQRLRAAAFSVLLLGSALYFYQAMGGGSLLGNALLLGAVGFLLFGPDSLLSGTVAQELGGSQATGSVAGVINGIGSVGAIFSPMLVAWISGRFGWSALFYGFVVVTLLASLLIAVGQALQARLAATSA